MRGSDVPGRRRAPARTRARLVTAAETLFAERGYASTTIQQICRRAGVSIGSFYHHFQDKPSLTAEVFERAHDGLVATLFDVDLGRPGSIESAVSGLLEGSGAALHRALREAVEVEPSLAPVAAHHRAALRDRVVATLRAARAHPDEDYALDAHSIAWTFMALVREAIATPGEPAARVIATVITCSAAARVRSNP